jgi:hypothetical protein
MHKTKHSGPHYLWQIGNTPKRQANPPLSDLKAKLVKSTVTLHNTTEHNTGTSEEKKQPI